MAQNATSASHQERELPRDQVALENCWDLTSLFPSVEAWNQALADWEQQFDDYLPFQGTLAQSAQRLKECIEFDMRLERLAERIGTYAFLRTTEDQGNSDCQAMKARFQSLAVRCSQIQSFIQPEILAIPIEQFERLVQDPVLADFKLTLQRIHRYRPHTLGEREEKLIAMQGEMAQTASQVFRQLTDADFKFGSLDNGEGQQVELTNASFVSFLMSPFREVRKNAFHQFYAQHAGHKNALAATLAGSVHSDVYYARARNHTSALDAALFPDNVPRSVYEQLIQAVRKHLPAVHRYLEVRRKKMGLATLHHYDTYVPIQANLQRQIPWDEAVQLVLDSLRPLGNEYCATLAKGFQSRWCDRYPNVGKQSGAFSCGTFDANPYILMNYKPNVLNDVFTLTHEAGHSMHSYYSARHQPYQYYNYTIFVAEVASTFNEQLLAHHLIEHTTNPAEKAFIVNHEIDSIRATIVRQTMFAEFEMKIHAMAEAGEPLTVDSMRSEYRQLLEAYFGPNFVLDDELSLECFRIPHFYRAFYVYKYATGLSAAIALSRRVLEGGKQELDDYLGFLRGGCSQDPLDLLRGAGVDMTSPQPVETALTQFSKLVELLDESL